MASDTASLLLEEIRTCSSEELLLSALKELKNDIIGHEQRKAVWVGLGVLPLMVDILRRPRISIVEPSEDASLHALVIVESIARGGSAFFDALRASNVLESLLGALSPRGNSAPLTLAALRTLNSIADSAVGFQPKPMGFSSVVFDKLFSGTNVQSLTEILSQSSDSVKVQNQISLTASIISKACHEERHKSSLASGGVLNTLAFRLANFIAAKGYAFHRNDDVHRNLPASTASSSRLAPILEAIFTIIRGSKTRAAHLLHSPALNNVLYWEYHEHLSDPSRPFGSRSIQPSAQSIPPTSPKPYCITADIVTRKFLSSPYLLCNPTLNTNDQYSDTGETYLESPLIDILLGLSRESTGLTRLNATAILVVLYRCGFATPDRETEFSLILVPYLADLIDGQNFEPNSVAFSDDPDESEKIGQAVKEKAPHILALLVSDSTILQKAAVDANAIKKIAFLLRKSFDPEKKGAKVQSWKAASQAMNGSHEKSTGPRTSHLGKAGMSAQTLHKMKVREATLMAIAHLTANTEEYRKTLVDQGVTAQIVSCLITAASSGTALNPSARRDASTGSDASQSHEENPESVLVAAAGAVRALARSVNVLRTGLIDAGVAVPLFDLLHHPNDEVKIAATAAVCNLILDFSPMRESIIQAGALHSLCSHAHSPNPRLRQNALWALKNVVYLADVTIRQKCLELLGDEWLIQLIESNHSTTSNRSQYAYDDNLSASPPILRRDTSSDMTDAGNETKIFDNDPNHKGVREQWIRNGEAQMKAWKALEEEQLKSLDREDTAIQEQALNLIRNIVCPPGTNEMIDMLLSKFGSDRLFGILTSKLRPIHASHSTKGKEASHSEIDRILIQPAEEIITAVTAILIHLAAGNPRHRQMLLSNTEMFRLLVPYLDHPNKEVRVNLVWVVINLTWVDNDSDRGLARSRAQELQKLGFQAKLLKLEQDPELDVRERVKTALYQLGISSRE